MFHLDLLVAGDSLSSATIGEPYKNEGFIKVVKPWLLDLLKLPLKE